MVNRKVLFTTELEIEVQATVTPPVNGRSVAHHNGPRESEPSQAEDMRVVVRFGAVDFDITHALPKEVRMDLESQCIDEAREQDDPR